MYGMPQRGRSSVDVRNRSTSRRSSSSRGGGGKHGGAVVPGPPVRAGVGASSRDSISASPAKLRRSSSRSGRKSGSGRKKSGSGRRSGSGQHRGGEAGEPAQRRRRRHRGAAASPGPGPEPQVQGQRQGHGDAASPLRGGGGASSPRTPAARREEVDGGGGGGAAAAVATVPATDVADGAAEAACLRADQAMSFRSATGPMKDDEREALLLSLSAAYTQVNDLTDELKASLGKLGRPDRPGGAQDPGPAAAQEPLLLCTPPPLLLCCQQAERPSTNRNLEESRESPEHVGLEDAAALQKRRTLSKIFHEVLPREEDAPSTPDTVRQLRVEVEALRHRDAQASEREKKYKSDISSMQRHIELLGSRISKDEDSAAASAPNSSSCHINTVTTCDKISSDGINGGSSCCCGSNNDGSRPGSMKLPPPDRAYCTTPGGTHYEDNGDIKSFVARVAELEENLRSSRAENAEAKQEHRTAKLGRQKLERSLHKLKDDLAKSRAMNDLLQKEVDRLQSRDPEDDARGGGWQRQWLEGLREPVSPEPIPIKVQVPEGETAYGSWRRREAAAPESNLSQTGGGRSNASSPAVLVGDLDLDKNHLVYTTDRAQFVYLDYMNTK